MVQFFGMLLLNNSTLVSESRGEGFDSAGISSGGFEIDVRGTGGGGECTTYFSSGANTEGFTGCRELVDVCGDEIGPSRDVSNLEQGKT